jgi:hypothetical protein
MNKSINGLQPSSKADQEVFTFKHANGDVFTYEDKKHAYKLNGISLPGTTTPLELVNELTWDDSGKMSSKSQILQQWALGQMATEIIEKIKIKELWGKKEIEDITVEAKGAPNRSFKSAGISGTEIHAECESYIKDCIAGIQQTRQVSQQTLNFIKWATNNKVKFLYSEEPIYSKEWMSCGTVDFICEINGKILVGDIKTNGNKRKYYWNGKGYDYSRPQSNIHINALFQTGCYAKMVTEDNARKLVEKVDGVVIVNVMKSGEFDEKLDVRYDYNLDSLIKGFYHIINLYQIYRNK